MYELVRYTFLVLLGLACLVTLFISIAITATIVAHNGETSIQMTDSVMWIWGAMAIAGCLWLSGTFFRSIYQAVYYWFQDYRDQITTYSVIGVIFIVFVIS